MSSATEIFPPTFLNVFCRFSISTLRQRRCNALLQKRSEVKTRKEKHRQKRLKKWREKISGTTHLI